MLSILIPIYNFDCKHLAQTLCFQAKDLGIDYELLAYDDGSTSLKEENRPIGELPGCRYVELKNNIGRAAIRNKLAQDAQYRYLLFMDCDSQVIRPDYVKQFVENRTIAPVICGGRHLCSIKELDKKYVLHWLYGIKREPKPGEGSGKLFLSNNFLIEKSVFDTVHFNEKIKGYGHEDTLFGIELEKNNLKIKYINNPLLHFGLETNAEFIVKTKEGIRNLHYISTAIITEKDARKIKLLRIHRIVAKARFSILISLIFKIAASSIEKQLMSSSPSLWLLDFYKIGYYCTCASGNNLHHQKKSISFDHK